jgi:hypothetical protein
VGSFSLYKSKLSELRLAQTRASCRSLCKHLRDSPCSIPTYTLISELHYQYQGHFPTNSSIHNINTGNEDRLRRPNANLSCFQKDTSYAAIKIFNSLPCSLTTLKKEKAKFKVALRKYLNTHTFYCVDEFVMCKDKL